MEFDPTNLEDLTNLNIENYLNQAGEQNLLDILEKNNFMNEFNYKDGHYRLRVKFLNKSNNPDPEYTDPGNSGFDLRANLDLSAYPDGEVIVPNGKIVLVPTGLFFELPEGFEIQVRPRSGLAIKYGITVLNTPGTVDSNYRGEVQIIVYNTGAVGDYVIKNGDRVAQAVISAVNTKNTVSLEKVSYLNQTERGNNGFGHSGVK